ncbi:MAG: bifunctional riboflavin kinase/FAD synthetase [Zoogloeaceae bacterium]|jgi:riboflavin kinase/FMN adenylyltransferase|nr:bifunctional riboflavin kinase/FAD synthetase [Zoogloeaceae bacterium]
MRLFRGFHAPKGQPCVLTIGNFDGLHLGHQALLSLLADRAGERGLPASVLTFEPHPREFFSPMNAPARLTSLREKLLLLGDNGVQHAHIQRFDTRFSSLDAEAFIEKVLVGGLNARHLLIGDDFCFGKARNGNFALLQAAGKTHGFEVEAMPTLSVAGERASSSAIRKALEAGDLNHAARLLGRAYSIAGQVTHGNQLGRQIGFPTLNIVLKHRRPALSGVFTVAVEGLSDARLRGVANVGIRPTVGNTPQSRLEVHLLDWSGNCYGAHLRVHFLHKLREECRFPSLDALKAQIGQDAEAARGWFSQHSG